MIEPYRHDIKLLWVLVLTMWLTCDVLRLGFHHFLSEKAANEVVSQLRFVVHEEEIDRCILSGWGWCTGAWRIAVKTRNVEFCKHISKKKHGKNLAR